MVALVLAVAVVAFVSVVPQVANDFWLQARVGEIIVREGRIPQTLLFPFTEVRDAVFHAHEWLASVAFYLLIRTVGEEGLPFVLGALGLLLYALTVWLAWRRSEGRLAVALLLGLTAIANENYRHTLRPELLSLLLFAIYLLLLDACRRQPARRWPWAVALLVVMLWVNVHASFLLAPVVAGLFAVGLCLDGARAQAPRFLLFAGAALACTLVSPLGLEQSLGIFSVGKSALARTAVLEWMPTFDAGFRQARFFWLSMLTTLGTAALLIWQGRRCSAVDVLMFLAFTVLAAWSIRFLVYVGLVAAFVLAPLARRPPLDPQRATRTWAWTGLVHALVLVVAARYGNANGSFPYRADAPEKLTLPMVQALGDPALSGNVITSYAFGAELVYRAYPRLKPSIDSRIDSYGDDYLRFHEAMLASEGLMEEFVGRYDVRYMLVKPAQFQAMQRWPSWTAGRWSVLLADSRAVLLQRNPVPRSAN